MARQSIWTNPDGLNVGFGTHKVDRHTSSKVATRGAVQEIILTIYGTDLVDVGPPDAIAISNAPIIPTDSLVTEAKLFVTTAFTSGGSATLDIGTYNPIAGSVTSAAGLASAVAVATLVDNYVATLAGAVVGTVLAAPAIVYASYNTAAFTAGVATLVVKYIPKIV